MKNVLKISVAIVSILIIFIIVKMINKGKTRGQKNNNPFNMNRTKTKWQGEIIGSDVRFCSFDTLENGIRAGLINLYNGYFSKNMTIQQIVGKYAPASDGNNERAYVDFISKYTGLASFSYPSKDEWMLVAWAILYFENGKQIMSLSELNKVAVDKNLTYYV